MENIMKKTIIALAILPSLAFAFTEDEQRVFMENNIQVLKEKGLPIPGSGVEVVPASKIKIPAWQKQQFAAEKKEFSKKGYIERSSERAYELMHIKASIDKEKLAKKTFMKPTDSDIRDTPSDMVFAYTYVGVPKGEMLESFGIAPTGTWVKEPQSGWTGAVQFFKTSFAHCAYTENNMVVSQGAARISEDVARYDVNGKVTVIEIEGNASTGYLYQVNWFDNVFNRNLECATMDFSEAVRTETIALAKKIDKA